MIHSKRSQEGYLLIDHRNSPGVPDSVIEVARLAGKYVPKTGADTLFESGTVTCCHCNVIVILNPDRSRQRHYCSKCHHYVCDKPSCVLVCKPFNQIIDELQNEAVKSLGKEEEPNNVKLILPPSL